MTDSNYPEAPPIDERRGESSSIVQPLQTGLIVESSIDALTLKVDEAIASLYEVRTGVQAKSRDLPPETRVTSLWNDQQIFRRVTEILRTLYGSAAESYLTEIGTDQVVDEMCWSTWELDFSDCQPKDVPFDKPRMERLLTDISGEIESRQSQKSHPLSMN